MSVENDEIPRDEKKVQAQRKFAQGAFVPPAPVQSERRTIEPSPENGVNVITSDISASKILDTVAFAHPGMHLHTPRVVLQRLTVAAFEPDSEQSTSSVNTTTRTEQRKKRKRTIAQSTRVLRSMCKSSESEDDRPLTYHINRKPTKKRHQKLRKGAAAAINQASERGKRKLKRTTVPGTFPGAKKRRAMKAKKRQKKNNNNTELDIGNHVSPEATVHKNDDLSVELAAFIDNHVSAEIQSISPDNGMAADIIVASADVHTEPVARIDNRLVHSCIPEVEQSGLHNSNNVKTTENEYSDSLNRMAADIIVGTADVHTGTASDTIATIADVRTDDLSVELAAFIDNHVSPETQSISPDNGMAADIIVATADIHTEPVARIDNRLVHSCIPEVEQSGLHNSNNVETTNNDDSDCLYDDDLDDDYKDHQMEDEDCEPDEFSCDSSVIEVPISDDKAAIPLVLRMSPDTDEQAPTESMPSTSTEPRFNEAPVYRPTSEEFSDPLKYYVKIAPEASKFGLCKVVAPEDFNPKCNLFNLDKLDAHHQYVARLFNRWGEATRFLSAIYACLASHGVKLPTLPLVDGLEINLPKLFRVVEKYGGFNEVTRKRNWATVAKELNLSKIKTPEKVLDNIYVKFLLPYDILNESERLNINSKAEDVWLEFHAKMKKRAENPLHCKKVYTGESEASGSEEDEGSEEVKHMRKRTLEFEECVRPGRKINLKRLRQVDTNAKQIFFCNGNPTVDEVENLYWEIVLQGADHVCVYSVSVDTSSTDVGFTTNPDDPNSRHPWNLKNILKNDDNILRSLGAVVSMTAPILHLGMCFTTNCWHRDPHGLPWVEYLHEGPGKIWYGIANEESAKFRKAVQQLCPTSEQNKKIWLSSDITMIPPKLLTQLGVTLTRTVQRPGEFIFIFPNAYSSSICTGLTISESVYFAVQPWLITIHKVFQELRESCEPMTFAPEQLLIALSRDERVSLVLLQQVFPNLRSIVEEELSCRYALTNQGLLEVFVGLKNPNKPWNVSEAVECDVCRRPLFLSKVTGKFHHPHLNQICPQDARHIIKKYNNNNLVLEVLVSEQELKEIVYTVQCKLL